MTDHDILPVPLVLTDDEIMALAAVTGRAWWSNLRSVDVKDDADMVTATARGLRSLGVRGLITDEGQASDPLSLVAPCLGAKPWAMVASVDSEDTVAADGPVLALFRAENGIVATRSDVSGTHLLHEFDLEGALELVSEQLGGNGAQDVAVVFASPDGQRLGGLRTRNGQCARMDAEGNQTGTIVEAPAGVQAAVREFWSAT